MNPWIILEALGFTLAVVYFVDVNTDGDFDLPYLTIKNNWERIFQKIKRFLKR